MEKQFECTKIKDGLYLGNIRVAQDLQFLTSNKFLYIVNCTSEIPNYFDEHGLKYVKFKLVRDKGHKLWEQDSIKKLQKLSLFIQKCQKNSLCCLIHSFDGSNRSLVMLSAFLMNKYKWTVAKTLEYIRSKNVFIGLSEHNINQLELLQKILQKPKYGQNGQLLEKITLTRDWRVAYRTQEEEIISKTYLNSRQITQKQNQLKKHQVEEDYEMKINTLREEKIKKKVIWLDKLDKQKQKDKKKQKQKSKIKNVKVQQQHKEKGFPIDIDLINQNYGKQIQKHEQIINFQSDNGISCRNNPNKALLKKNKNYTSNYQINRFGISDTQTNQLEKQKRLVHDQMLENDKILKLIKMNLTKNIIKETEEDNEKKDKVYNLTINNFIKPNINFIGNPPPSSIEKDKKNLKNRPNSNKKQEKMNRTFSAKQAMKGLIKQKIFKKKKQLSSQNQKQTKIKSLQLNKK